MSERSEYVVALSDRSVSYTLHKIRPGLYEVVGRDGRTYGGVEHIGRVWVWTWYGAHETRFKAAEELIRHVEREGVL